MNQLSIVLAKFPFTNQADYKIRPVVIISNDKFNQAHCFCWACPVTSQTTMKEFELEIKKTDFSGELKTQSFIRTDTIASMEKNLFLKEIGEINNSFFERLKKELLKNL